MYIDMASVFHLKVVIFLLTVCFNYTYSSSCYWNSDNPYKLFSTKTPYINVRGDIRDSAKINDCEPISIWGLFRHGKRTPGEKFSKQTEQIIEIRKDIIARHKEGRGSLCAQDVENLQNWKVDKELFANLHDMTKEGLSEMVGIGQRLKQAFPDLLRDLKPHTYTFRSNRMIYIHKCIYGFLEGLSQLNLKVDKSKKRDVMAPFDDCKEYKKWVKHNPDTFTQAMEYLNSTEYLMSKDKIATRLGLNYTLTNENVTALYDLCRYTWSALENKRSPWCALFDEEDLKIQEFYEDLRLYYRNGYGNSWNLEFGQIPLADLLNTFRTEINGVKPPKKITAYFSHATMLTMVYSALGLHEDYEPLTANKRDVNRNWRTSEHAIFAGNLVAVLNKCYKNGTDTYAVAFYMNEKPLERLCDLGVCTWDEFETMLRPTENKTFESVCYRDLDINNSYNLTNL